jgi:hypothetical protein
MQQGGERSAHRQLRRTARACFTSTMLSSGAATTWAGMAPAHIPGPTPACLAAVRMEPACAPPSCMRYGPASPAVAVRAATRVGPGCPASHLFDAGAPSIVRDRNKRRTGKSQSKQQAAPVLRHSDGRGPLPLRPPCPQIPGRSPDLRGGGGGGGGGGDTSAGASATAAAAYTSHVCGQSSH